jgi:hypothetical protein
VKDFKLKKPVKAAQIQSILGQTITTTDDETINVTLELIAKFNPRPGDVYVDHPDDGISIMTELHFDAKFADRGTEPVNIEPDDPVDIIEVTAMVAHEVNRAYCQSLGDGSQVSWGEAPDWQKESAMVGVQFHLDNPDAGPEASHESWLEMKKADGWKYGKKKDEEKKTHPCFKPFAKLPKAQQAKDHLFRGVVHALS